MLTIKDICAYMAYLFSWIHKGFPWGISIVPQSFLATHAVTRQHVSTSIDLTQLVNFMAHSNKG